MRLLKLLVIMTTLVFLADCHNYPGKEKKEAHEHTDTSGYSLFRMLFEIQPARPAPGQEVQIHLKPTRTGTDSIVPLQIQHEKKIHLIVVASNLSSFKHLHPIEQTDGSYSITDSFSHGGEYLLYADYQPTGSEKVVDMHSIHVTGDLPAPVPYDTTSLRSNSNGYSVVLDPGSAKFSSGKEIMLTAKFSDQQGELSPGSLENYLGEKAHMVIIGITNRKYLHVHPILMNDELMLHTSFPEAGIYRAWLEFKKDGKVNTADFTFKVD